MTDFLQQFSDWCTYGLLGIPVGSQLAGIVSYFIYDSIRINVLLFVMIFIIGVLRTYISSEQIHVMLSKKIPVLPNIAASLFGAVTPFCSCSSIPIFISFIESGVPLGVSLSFLITSPLVNEYAAVLMFGFFGPKITIVYILSGIILGVVAGVLIGRIGMEKHLVPDIAVRKRKDIVFSSFMERLAFGYSEARDIIGKLWLWVLVGIGIGALIHGMVPESTVHSLIKKSGVFAVPIAVLLGIPMYSSCGAIVPIAAAFISKGVPVGTAIAFMMAVAALSLPEAIILRRVMKLKLLALFFGLVALGIILIGYLLNMVF